MPGRLAEPQAMEMQEALETRVGLAELEPQALLALLAQAEI